jgi:ABC-type polysaccharide/polyol phosphate transport system ATPase subunit
MTVSIEFNDLSVSYPIYGFRSKSIKSLILNKTIGGIINIPGDYSSPEIIALRQINLKIDSNERVGLIGHNGSGKSTLLRVIMGSYPATSGSINVLVRVSSMINLKLGID